MTASPRDWRKSSRSQNMQTCVEVSHDLDRLRDSKNPHGPTLPGNVTALVAAIRDRKLDR